MKKYTNISKNIVKILYNPSLLSPYGGLKIYNLNTNLAHKHISHAYCPEFRLVTETRMRGFFRMLILIAKEIILMTRMIAQICKNTKENKENTPKGAAAKRPPPWGRGRRPRLCFLYFP